MVPLDLARLGLHTGLVFRLCLLSALVYVVGICIYRIFFHPLAKYPGPLLAKVTGIRAAYFAWRGDLHVDVWRCHEKYGDCVRYSPDRVLFNSAAGMRDIYGFGKSFAKAKGYQATLLRHPSTFTLLDKKEHGRTRRLLGQAFSDAALRSFEPSIIAQVEKFCSNLCPAPGGPSAAGSKGWSAALNMSSWCDYLFFDLITDVVFGRTYNLLNSPKNRHVINAIQRSNVRTSVLVQLPAMPLWGLDRLLFPKGIVATKRLLKFVQRLLRERMETKNRKDIFSILHDAKDPETNEGLDPLEIGAESAALLIAGSDTSSTLMASMFFYLGCYPSVYATVCSEVRSAFASASEIRMGPKLYRCKYLRACLDECLRMSPPVGAPLLREVPTGGATIDGHHIPEGMLVGTGIYSIHHNPLYFSDPFAFRPERWLGGGARGPRGADMDATPASLGSFSPFSMGSRSCVGKGLALTENMLAMATVIWHFDFKVAEPNDGTNLGAGKTSEFRLRDHSKNGPFIQFRRRRIAATEGQDLNGFCSATIM